MRHSVDVQSGEAEEEEVMAEGIGEQEMEELVPEWGLRMCPLQRECVRLAALDEALLKSVVTEVVSFSIVAFDTWHFTR